MDGPLAIAVSLHLFVEYWLNQLIQAKCPNADTILDDKRNLTFYVKLQLVYGMGLIPERIFSNIKRLNKLRNSYAHNLDFDALLAVDLDYFDPGNRVTIRDFPSAIREKKVTRKDLLLWIGVVTYGWLHNHCMESHGLFPGTDALGGQP